MRRNVISNFAGNLVYAACQWGVLVSLAKMGTPSTVGLFALGLAMTGPIFMFANLQLRTVQATDTQGEFQFGEYLGVRLVSSLVALTIVLVTALAARYNTETTLVVLLVGLAKTFESVSDAFYGMLHQHERMDRVAKSLVVHGVLSVLSLTVGFCLTHSLLWAAVAFACSQLAVLVAYDIPGGWWALKDHVPLAERAGNCWACIRPSFDADRLGKLAWKAFPLGVAAWLISLNTNVPRYFIVEAAGKHGLGIFSALAALMVAGTTVFRAIDQPSCPRLARAFHSGRISAFWSFFAKLLGIYSLLGFAAVAVAAMAGRPLLRMLFSEEYAQHTDVLVYLMLALWVAYLSGAVYSAMIAVRLLRMQLPLQVSSIAVSAAVCYFLVPTMGLRGAAIATAVAKAPYVVVGLVMLWRFTHQHAPTTATLELQPHFARNSRRVSCAES